MEEETNQEEIIYDEQWACSKCGSHKGQIVWMLSSLSLTELSVICIECGLLQRLTIDGRPIKQPKDKKKIKPTDYCG